jgi:hypothetical protein
MQYHWIMLNTSFSNKTQLKNIFFYFTGSDPVQCIFELWTGAGSAETYLHCSREQWSMFSVLPHRKQVMAASFFLAFQTQQTVGFMNSNIHFFNYQTGCICVFNKTQTQPLKQILSKYWPQHGLIVFLKLIFFNVFFICLDMLISKIISKK